MGAHMSYQTERVLKIIFIIFTISIGIMLFGIYQHEQREQIKQKTAWEAVAEKVRPYEKEQNELETELSELKKVAEYTPDKAEVMVGFLVSEVSDMEYIRNKADVYKFPPIIVIDCTADEENIKELVQAMDTAWEIMLYAPQFSDEIGEKVISVKTLLETFGKKYADAFFLKKDYQTKNNTNFLLQNGFVGYTLYHDTPESGQTEDGTVYFDYSHIRSGSTAVLERLASAAKKKASILLTFDMKSIETGELTDEVICEILDKSKELLTEDGVSYATVALTTKRLSKINQKKAELQEEYEQKAARIQTRIDELETIIWNIYSEQNTD